MKVIERVLGRSKDNGREGKREREKKQLEKKVNIRECSPPAPSSPAPAPLQGCRQKRGNPRSSDFDVGFAFWKGLYAKRSGVSYV